MLGRVLSLCGLIIIFMAQLGLAHPRIFFTSADIPHMRLQAQGSHQEIWLPIKTFVDNQLGTPPPVNAPACPDLEAFRIAAGKLIPFAFAYVITGDTAYFTLARDHLMAYARWPYWGEEQVCGGKDLGYHHMLLANALAYDWLYPALSGIERQLIRNNLIRRTQASYEAAGSDRIPDGSNWWRNSLIQNHHSTNNSTLGIAALALEGEDLRAQLWLDRAVTWLTRNRDLFEGIGDGTWHEGMSYTDYNLTLKFPFIYNLKRLKGLDLLPHSYLRHHTAWRVYNSLPDTWRHALSYGNFQWSWGASYSPQNVLRFIAAETQDGRAEWMAQHFTQTAGRGATVYRAPWYVFEFFYYDPQLTPQPPDGLPLSRTFPDLQGVIWRTGWTQDDLVFGLKTGPAGGRFAATQYVNARYPLDDPDTRFNVGHNHDDSGTFYLYRGNRDLASEVVGPYETRYHNTILIDEKGQFAPPYDSVTVADMRHLTAQLSRAYQTGHFNYVLADSTHRYAVDLTENTRRVLFVRPSYFVMIDNIKALTSHHYDWVCHFDQAVSVSGNWIRGDSEDGQSLGVYIASPNQFHSVTGHDGKPYIHVSPATDVQETRFISVLYPTDTASWDRRPTIQLIANPPAGSGVRVELEGKQDHLFRYAGQAPITLAHYTLEADVASVIRDTTGALRRLFLGNGTRLTERHGARPLLDVSMDGNAIEAVYQNAALSLSGTGVERLRIFAPGVQSDQVQLNGRSVPVTRQGAYLIYSRNPSP